MTNPIKAALGCFALFVLLWGVAMYFFGLTDAEAFASARQWHAWLPFYMSRVQDVPAFPVFVAALAIAAAASMVGGALRLPDRLGSYVIGAVAVVAFAFVLWGSSALYFDYPLSMDEYFADYQAKVYASGAIGVPVPEQWASVHAALFHRFMRTLAGGTFWFGGYLPVHSLLRAPFQWLGAPQLLNALGVAGSIVLVAMIARRLFPSDRLAPVAAALLMAGSAQVIITGMTAYAHTMHLFLNLVWLALFLSDRRWAVVVLPWIGALAIGLHQVHYHLLFAFPFFVWMVWRRRWGWLAYTCPIYGAAFLGFSNWWRLADLLFSGHGSVAVTDMATTQLELTMRFARSYTSLIYNSLAAGLNIFRLVAWQHLLLLPLVFVALWHWRRLPTVVKLLAIGCAITLVARFIVTPNPGHQWGYRYMHNMLGNLVLLAVAGLVVLRQDLPADWRPRATRLLAWSSLASLLILVPMRGLQVSQFVRPFAQASAYLAHLPADVVIIDTATIWIGADLVRNDPWLRNRPLLLDKSRLSADQQAALAQNYRVLDINFDDLRQFGMKRGHSRKE